MPLLIARFAYEIPYLQRLRVRRFLPVAGPAEAVANACKMFLRSYTSFFQNRSSEN